MIHRAIARYLAIQSQPVTRGQIRCGIGYSYGQIRYALETDPYGWFTCDETQYANRYTLTEAGRRAVNPYELRIGSLFVSARCPACGRYHRTSKLREAGKRLLQCPGGGQWVIEI